MAEWNRGPASVEIYGFKFEVYPGGGDTAVTVRDYVNDNRFTPAELREIGQAFMEAADLLAGRRVASATPAHGLNRGDKLTGDDQEPQCPGLVVKDRGNDYWRQIGPENWEFLGGDAEVVGDGGGSSWRHILRWAPLTVVRLP